MVYESVEMLIKIFYECIVLYVLYDTFRNSINIVMGHSMQIILKFETNFSMYMETTRYLMQVYVLWRLRKYLNSQLY